MTDTPLVQRIEQAIRDAAYDCDGNCGLAEHECDDQHPIQVAACHFSEVHSVYGDVDALAATAMAVVRPELDRIPLLEERVAAAATSLGQFYEAIQARLDATTDAYREGDAYGATFVPGLSRAREVVQRVYLDGGRAEVGPNVGHLDLATEFRIPCPEPADPGRPAGAPVLRPEPLIIQKIAGYWATKFPDGWMILNPNLEPGGQVWTGERWEYNGQVFAGVKYQWTRDQAIALGRDLAVEETWRFEMWLARMRAGREG